MKTTTEQHVTNPVTPIIDFAACHTIPSVFIMVGDSRFEILRHCYGWGWRNTSSLTPMPIGCFATADGASDDCCRQIAAITPNF